MPASTVESLVVAVKYDTNRKELALARADTEKLKAASRMLEEEQRKGGKTTQKLREDLQDLRVALHKGIIDKTTFRKRTAEVRLALGDEANAAARAASGLKLLRAEHVAATKAARAHEAAERAASKSIGDPANAGTGARGAGRNRSSARGRRGIGVVGVAVGTAAGNFASGAARTGIHAIGSALEESFQAASRFESAMADVAKVVDGLKTPAGQTTQAYHALADELKNLSTRIAVTPDGLAEMAAAAGQAGIKGGELTRFVEDAAKTMVAFDITSEEAGNGLAKLRANLGLSQDGVVQLAGTMNVLSNSMASTAAEVLDATLRVGAVGKAANVSGQEVAGYTSAMIAAGATSEIAATATKNFILSMAAGTAATKRQREAFSKLGLNAGDVAKQFTGTAEQRLAVSRKVITQLGKLSADARASTTMQLFGRESLGPIASLTTNLKTFDDAMRLATDSTAAATSVENEYAVRSKTTANAVQLLKNQMSVTAIEIGEGMIPAIREVMREMGEFFGATQKAGKSIGETLGEGIMKAWRALRDFLGPAEELPGKITRMVEAASKFASAAISVASAIASVIGYLGPAETGVLALGIAVAGMAGPWGIAAAAAVVACAEISAAIATLITKVPGIGDAVLGAKDYMLNLAAQVRGKEIGDKSRSDDDAAYERANSGSMSAGRSSMHAEDASRAAQQPKLKAAAKKTFVETVRDEAAAKRARFNKLQSKKRSGAQLRPSEATEIKALSKEFDEPIARKPGKGAGKHKAESAFEGELEGEIDRLSKEAGKRAGLKAAAQKQSRGEQYKAAQAAEKATKSQLQGRVDAGMSLPGNFMHDRLQENGFGDVAGRGTPPPIAVTIVDVKPMNVAVNFTGPVTSNPREIRDQVVTVFREEMPRALSAGIREARTGALY